MQSIKATTAAYLPASVLYVFFFSQGTCPAAKNSNDIALNKVLAAILVLHVLVHSHIFKSTAYSNHITCFYIQASTQASLFFLALAAQEGFNGLHTLTGSASLCRFS